MRTAQMWTLYTDWVLLVGECSRLEAAEHFEVSKTTATYHLEQAVMRGELVRFYAWTKDNQTGWAYAIPEPVGGFAGDPEEYGNIAEGARKNPHALTGG